MGSSSHHPYDRGYFLQVTQWYPRRKTFVQSHKLVKGPRYAWNLPLMGQVWPDDKWKILGNDSGSLSINML